MGIRFRVGSKVAKTVKTTKNFPLTIEHVRTLFSVADLRERIILSMATDLGLRVGDFIGIKKTDLPPLDQEPPISFDLMTSKEEVVAHGFLSHETVDLLKAYLPTLEKKNVNPYLFPSNGTAHISDEWLNRLQRLAENAKINLNGKSLTFHCFREMFLSTAIDSGTQELNRNWIGIGITHSAISLIRSRLKKIHVYAGKDYRIIGEPVDLASAEKLAKDDKYQFQYWAVSLIDAFPVGQSSKSPYGKKGADKGIDGWLTFKEGANIDLKRIVVHAKRGHNVGASEVRDLVGTVQNTKSAMGILITLDEPTQPMKIAAMEAGYYESPTWGHEYLKIQILTIPELLKGSKPILPHTH